MPCCTQRSKSVAYKSILPFSDLNLNIRYRNSTRCRIYIAITAQALISISVSIIARSILSYTDDLIISHRRHNCFIDSFEAALIYVWSKMAAQISFSTTLWESSRATSHYLSAYTRSEPSSLVNHLDEIMTSAAFPSAEQLIQKINVDGFFFLQDASKGSEAEEFKRKKFPITTVGGLEFYKAHTLSDPVRSPHSVSSHFINMV